MEPQPSRARRPDRGRLVAAVVDRDPVASLVVLAYATSPTQRADEPRELVERQLSQLRPSMISRASAVGCHPLREVPSLRRRGSPVLLQRALSLAAAVRAWALIATAAGARLADHAESVSLLAGAGCGPIADGAHRQGHALDIKAVDVATTPLQRHPRGGSLSCTHGSRRAAKGCSCTRRRRRP